MFERLQKLLDRIESRIALWTVLSQGLPVVSVGAITAWLSSGTEWINQYGWFGWWVAGLLGALAASTVLLLSAWVRLAWIKASAIRKWKDDVSDVNPMVREFRNERINILDMRHPVTGAITGKRFYDCELFGPANIFFFRNTLNNHTGFLNCVAVVLQESHDGKIAYGNAVVMEDVELHNCKIWGCTLLLHPEILPEFIRIGLTFSTLTGIDEFDQKNFRLKKTIS